MGFSRRASHFYLPYAACPGFMPCPAQSPASKAEMRKKTDRKHFSNFLSAYIRAASAYGEASSFAVSSSYAVVSVPDVSSARAVVSVPDASPAWAAVSASDASFVWTAVSVCPAASVSTPVSDSEDRAQG